MAEAVVSSVGQTIGNLLIDEAKFLWGVEDKVEDLYRELRLIRCLLRDADTRGEHNQAVGECVAQLRDVAYDAEDVIERYTLRVELKKGQYITRACACFLARQVHAVGTQIEGLKSRISNLRMSMLAFGAQPGSKGELKRTKASMLKRKYDHFQEDFIGREHSVKVLVEELSNGGETHRVIFICGMGGVGKTSLAKKVVAHDKVKNNFDDLAWVCVSQEYHVKDILEKIFVKLKPNQRDELTKMDEDGLLRAVYNTQKEKRCIVVLDDIWTKEAWDSLQPAFPIKDTRSKSKLLITTRNREVAEHIDPRGLFHELQCLLDPESWDLLKKRAFPRTKGLAVEISSDGPGVGQGTTLGPVVEGGIARQLETEEQVPVITQDMKRLGKELLQKCGGLPLAIIVLGGLLAINEWKTVHEKINLYLGDKGDVLKVLALSYDDLPWHLKPCFLYLGSFSEDAEIPAMKVLRMWIAEGFVLLDEYDEEREIPVEDIAEQYLVELINRGMVQVQFNSSGKIKTCCLHDLMRDLCLSRARQERFLSILNIHQDHEARDCSPSMATKVKSTCKTRRLSVNMSDKGNMIPREKQIGRTMLNLRTLMSSRFDEWMWKQLLPICKFLRVLKLEDLPYFRKNLPKSMGDLVHLRFISLARSRFKGLPQSLGNLIYMEFLDIHTNPFMRVIVPNVLWKMRRLRYLRLPARFAVKKRFCGDQSKLQLNTLNSLRILKNFSLKMCDVNNLSKLTNMQKLTMIGRCDSNNFVTVPRLGKFNLKHLQPLFFLPKSSQFPEGELSMTLSQCHNCEIFLYGKIKKLPEHESLPQQLRKLVLVDSQLEEDPMPILEKLPHLVFLMLGHAFTGKKMVCSAGGFPQLKHLLFDALLDLEEWRAAEGAVPHLSRLGIWSCPKLGVVPSHVSTYDGTDEICKELRKCGIM